MARSRSVAILAEMGTGKTLITISIAGALYNNGKINKMLIVAPLSIVPVWEEEIKKFADYEFNIATLEGTTSKNN